MLSMTSTLRTSYAVVRIDGQVQSGDNEAFAAGLKKLLELPTARLILDCAELEYLNSRGLGDLLAFYQGLKGRGGELAVAAARPGVLKVMRVVGLDRFLESFQTVEAAEKSWAAQG